MPSHRCWGYELTNGGTTCTVGFSLGVGHFQGKFCPSCIATGIQIEAARALLLPEGTTSIANMSGPSTYSGDRGILYRLVNQTHRCKGAAILILRSPADAVALGFPRVPESLLVSGRLHLSVVNGTLVPTAHLTRARSVGDRPTHALSAMVSLPSCSSNSASVGEVGGSDYGSTSGSSVADAHEQAGGQSLRSLRKQSRVDTCQAASGSGGHPSGSNVLLHLATLHAQASSSLQEALDVLADSTDARVQAYHSALRGTLQVLAQAAEASQLATRSLPVASPGAIAPGTGLSFPPSPPFTAWTATRRPACGDESLVGHVRLQHGELTPPEEPHASSVRVPSTWRPYFVCDRYSILACFCGPVLFGQLWQRHTRTRHSCVC